MGGAARLSISLQANVRQYLAWQGKFEVLVQPSERFSILKTTRRGSIPSRTVQEEKRPPRPKNEEAALHQPKSPCIKRIPARFHTTIYFA